jgi:hypothetical protein
MKNCHVLARNECLVGFRNKCWLLSPFSSSHLSLNSSPLCCFVCYKKKYTKYNIKKYQSSSRMSEVYFFAPQYCDISWFSRDMNKLCTALKKTFLSSPLSSSFHRCYSVWIYSKRLYNTIHIYLSIDRLVHRYVCLDCGYQIHFA